jgi:hypothetical protein
MSPMDADDAARDDAAFGRPPSSSTELETGANEDFLFHLYRGSELLGDNRVHEAKEELESALKLQPRDPKGQDLLAVVYFRLGLYPRAIAIYEELKRQNRKEAALKLNLALCYLKTGQTETARRELEELVAMHPQHARAWGYLGLVYDRIGEFGKAEHAFTLGGHPQMAKRVSERVRRSEFPGRPPVEVREMAQEAFQELDAGELSFALAEPVSDTSVESQAEWMEIGHPSPRPPAADPKSPPSSRAPSVPHLGVARGPRRPTLVAPALLQPPPESPPTRTPRGAPPPPAVEIGHFADPPRAASAREGSGILSAPIARPHDLEPLPLSRTPSAPPPRRAGGAASAHIFSPDDVVLPLPAPPSFVTPPAFPAPAFPEPAIRSDGAAAWTSSEPLTDLSEDHHRPPRSRGRPEPEPTLFSVPFDPSIHPSGLAFVRLDGSDRGYAARLASIRTLAGALRAQHLERRSKGKSTQETFGGVSSPVVELRGSGEVGIAPKAGHVLVRYQLDRDAWFFREDLISGFDLALTFENGRLSSGDGELVPMVQLRGAGTVLVEVPRAAVALDVRSGQGLSVRREAILGWHGRIVPRGLPAHEAPCSQRGLVAFAGDGQVLILA